MPIRWQIDRGYTIAALDTQNWWWNWFYDSPDGNQGPVIFRALPTQGGNNTISNILVTYDFAKCRGGIASPNGAGVYYNFKIRNESIVDVPFVLEIVLFSDLPVHHG